MAAKNFGEAEWIRFPNFFAGYIGARTLTAGRTLKRPHERVKHGLPTH